MSFKGIHIYSGSSIIFRTHFIDSSGDDLTTGSPTLSIYEIQNDGSLNPYDFNSDIFDSTSSLDIINLTHQVNGIWTYVLDSTAFVESNIYLTRMNHSSASPKSTIYQFQFDNTEGSQPTRDELTSDIESIPDLVWDELVSGHTTPGSYGVRALTSKYMFGSVWIDTIGGSAGAVDDVHGVFDNPCSAMADALTVATSIKSVSFKSLGSFN